MPGGTFLIGNEVVCQATHCLPDVRTSSDVLMMLIQTQPAEQNVTWKHLHAALKPLDKMLYELVNFISLTGCVTKPEYRLET